MFETMCIYTLDDEPESESLFDGDFSIETTEPEE
jgi:hypothetical protein